MKLGLIATKVEVCIYWERREKRGVAGGKTVKT